MIAYLETSAAAKLIFREPETGALRTFVDDDSVHVLSSFLLETELRRAAVREGAGQDHVTALVSRVELVELSKGVYSHAGMLPGRIRSLDALHIAAALAADADIIISYDERQIRAAEAVGLSAVSPT